MKKLTRERFLTRLGEFEAGYVVGHLAGVGVWFQLLTALFFEQEATGEGRLVLGEASFAPDSEDLAPRNACIIPWNRVQGLYEDGGELIIEVGDGRLRIVPAGPPPRPEL
ncbi:MAG TPA: hypothetical protein VIL95_04865 [Bacillota bacterium]